MNFIPLSIPNFEGNERQYVDDAVAQGWVSTGGAYITLLEKEMAAFLNTEEVAACQSGTSGLHLALIDAGVQSDDIVIVPSLTFIAAVNPVRYQFAETVFMDCDDSLCIDPIKIEDFCEKECEFRKGHLIHRESGKCVKAVVVVHVFGNMADMEAITDIAERYNLIVIEDATEALGTKYTAGRFTGKYAGTIGDYGVFSFNGNKIITTGGGGAVTAKKVAAIRHMRYLSTQAKDDPLFYVHNEIGYNYRMTNVQAAIGVAQLEELQEFIGRKQKNYDLYRREFDGCPYCELLKFREGTDSNKWFYSLKIDFSQFNFQVRDLISILQKKGIQTRAIWSLIHHQKPYRDSIAYRIEDAEKYSASILNIPCSTQITESEIRLVARQIKEILGEYFHGGQ